MPYPTIFVINQIIDFLKNKWIHIFIRIKYYKFKNLFNTIHNFFKN